jgi:hypothetical protein
MCTTFLSLLSQSLILYLSCRNIFSVLHVFWLRKSEATDSCLKLIFEYQLIVGFINPSYNCNSILVSFESVFLSQWHMGVELHRPPKPEESENNSNFFNGIWNLTQNLWLSSRYS